MLVSPSFLPVQTAIAPSSSCSPPNQSVQIHASQHKNAPTLSTRVHLSNLEKLLQKPTPPSELIKQTSSACPSTSTNRRLATPLSLSVQSSPDKIQTEAMSPRSLAHLQHLLSDSQPSPRGDISQDWRKYHGCDNWFGLLEPLNPHLRREILRCGDLVQSAYNAYYSHPSHDVSLSDQSYRVTSSLFATSSVQIPQWISSFAPWISSTKSSSWIGYVAVCDDAREIRRMGRRDIAIVLRGTATCLEWAENFRAGLVPIEPNENDGAKVECGFRSLYKTPGDKLKSLSSSVVAEVQRLLKKYKGEELSITVTGHSLGAALSVLVADEISRCAPNMPPISVFSFGGPRIGNQAFVNRVESRGVKVLRVVNVHDMVTRVPGLLPREDIKQRFDGSWQERLLEKVDGYVHVGRELRVDSRMSPVLRPDADLACCHDLEAYLHLIDGFMAANCPFRVNAKRSLVRLLNQQGGNIKQVFISKARAIQLDQLASKAAMEEATSCAICTDKLSHPSPLFMHQSLIESK